MPATVINYLSVHLWQQGESATCKQSNTNNATQVRLELANSAWWSLLVTAVISTKCYNCSGSRVGSLIRVWIPAAVLLAEGGTTTEVGDARLLVAAVGEVGVRCLLQVLGHEDRAALRCSWLRGAAGDEAPGVILWGVDQREVATRAVIPRCGALISGGCSLGIAPPLLLLQL